MLHVLSFDHLAFMRKTQQPARLADENDYGGWEALWTDDALYWVPVDSAGSDPVTSVSVIYDNRRRTTYRLREVAGGARLSCKKVVLVDLDQPAPTLGFLL